MRKLKFGGLMSHHVHTVGCRPGFELWTSDRCLTYPTLSFLTPIPLPPQYPFPGTPNAHICHFKPYSSMRACLKGCLFRGAFLDLPNKKKVVLLNPSGSWMELPFCRWTQLTFKDSHADSLGWWRWRSTLIYLELLTAPPSWPVHLG